MYWLDPYHYVIEGLVTVQLHDIEVRCASDEFSIFNVPVGQTCQQYASEFLKTATGYINNPYATEACQYCQYSKGQDFYEGLNMDFEHRWRNVGIMCLYLCTNVVLVTLGVKYYRNNRR